MFGIDEGTDAAALLRLGDGLQRERRLAGRFRPVDFNHPSLGEAADTERDVESERTGRNRFDFGHRIGAELHDRAFAERPLDLAQCSIERLALVHGGVFDDPEISLPHNRNSLFHMGPAGANDPEPTGDVGTMY